MWYLYVENSAQNFLGDLTSIKPMEDFNKPTHIPHPSLETWVDMAITPSLSTWELVSLFCQVLYECQEMSATCNESTLRSTRPIAGPHYGSCKGKNKKSSISNYIYAVNDFMYPKKWSIIIGMNLGGEGRQEQDLSFRWSAYFRFTSKGE